MKSIDLDKINSLLEELKNLQFREAITLCKRLKKEKQKLETQKPPKQKPTVNTNQKRSSFMKNVWRYVKLTYDTYPELREKYTLKQVFAQFFARRRGEDVEINDVIWQNPSA
ncbi:hypothetical protein YTPLAS73_09610 [Nitrosarchaeum sp.]|nr:hypothetical protein YTPLAS73_09610 [Nitrosarchaeum sp.]